MKPTKYLIIPAITLLSSCTWTENQTHNFMQWSDRNMPTFDGSHMGVDKPTITPQYPGDNGVTPAEAGSAMQGGVAHPPAPNNVYPPVSPSVNNNNAAGMMNNSADRRTPSGNLPPSAIQPVPYGQLHAPSAGAATSDMPSEYKDAGKANAADYNNSIMPPM